jgi:hypothetical protein
MKLICWVLCGSAIILACVLTRAEEPGRAPGPGAAAQDGAPVEFILRVYPIGDLIHAPLDEPLGEGAVPATQLMRGDLIHRQVRDAPLGMAPVYQPRPDLVKIASSNLIDLIKSQINDIWENGHGGTMDVIDGTLAVRQTPANQRRIADILQQLREHREASRSVTVQADWLLLSPGELSLILRADQTGASTVEVDPVALSKLGPRAFYARGRISCVGGQTAHVLSGRVRTLIESLEASVGTDASAYQPVVEEELSGAALQITPHICDNWATVDVLSFVSEWNEPGEPYRMGTENFANKSTTRPAGDAGGSGNDEASIDRLNAPSQQLCTTVRLALGKPAIVGGMTLDPDQTGAGKFAGAQGRQIYLVLRLDAELIR